MRWLASDNNDPGKEYLEIYKRICRLFSLKGCNSSEDLADKVMERMQELAARSKLPEGQRDHKLRYLANVAKYVHYEYLDDNRRHYFEQVSNDFADSRVESEVDVEGM